MSWAEFGLLSFVTALVVFVPGYVIARCAGARRVMALGSAAPVSVFTIAVSAVTADMIGLAWGFAPVLTVTTTLALLCLFVRLVANKAGLAGSDTSEIETEPTPVHPVSSTPRWIWWVLSGIGAITLMVHNVVVIIGSPNAFSQTYDNVFHLNAVRWILDNANGSSLTMDMVSGDQSPAFYPLAWHDTISLVLTALHSTDVAAGTNALALVTAALVWTVGCFYLVHVCLPCNIMSIVAVGFLSGAFPSFPYDSLSFGILYPNFYGLAMLPAVVALTVQILRIVRVRPSLSSTIPVGTLALGGMTLAHPNLLLLYCAILLPTMVVWVIGQVRHARAAGDRRRARLALVFNMIVVIMIVLIWIVLRPSTEQDVWEPNQTSAQAFGQGVLGSPMSGFTAWLAGALTIIGACLIIRERRNLWALCAHVLVIYLWIVVASFPVSPYRTALVGGWYSDPHRIAEAIPTLALLLSVTAVVWVERLIMERIHDRITMARGGSLLRLAEAGLAVATAIVLMFTTQMTSSVRRAVGTASDSYQVAKESPLVDSDEYLLIQDLKDYLPEGAVIATVPYNGSSMAYALEGITTTTTAISYTATTGVELINNKLDEVSATPQVCEALNTMGVDYALDFGPRSISSNRTAADYPGFDNLPQADGFVEIAREGHAVLYRITACD